MVVTLISERREVRPIPAVIRDQEAGALKLGEVVVSEGAFIDTKNSLAVWPAPSIVLLTLYNVEFDNAVYLAECRSDLLRRDVHEHTVN